jgi:hypothetical protein
MHRVASVALAAVLVSLIGAGCGGSRSETGTATAVHHESTQTFASRPFDLSFRYPSSWNVRKATRPETETFGFSMAVAHLSNQRLTDPCSVSHPRGGGTSIDCGWPVARLHPGGFFANLIAVGRPDAGLDFSSPDLKVEGRPAVIDEHASRCGAGASRKVEVSIDRPAEHHSWYDWFACVAGPDAKETEQQLLHVISSTQFSDSRFGSIAAARAFIARHVDVPVRLPTGLPRGTTLAPSPVNLIANQHAAQLALALPNGSFVTLEYGLGGFDGCGPLHPRAVKVAGAPAVIETDKSTPGRTFTTVVWPATMKNFTGDYAVDGEISGAQALDFARSMAGGRGRAGSAGASPGC